MIAYQGWATPFRSVYWNRQCSAQPFKRNLDRCVCVCVAQTQLKGRRRSYQQGCHTYTVIFTHTFTARTQRNRLTILFSSCTYSSMFSKYIESPNIFSLGPSNVVNHEGIVYQPVSRRLKPPRVVNHVMLHYAIICTSVRSKKNGVGK